VQQKLDEERRSRISLVKKLPKVGALQVNRVAIRVGAAATHACVSPVIELLTFPHFNSAHVQVNAQAAARILAEQAGLDTGEEGGKKKKKAAATGQPTLLEASGGG